MKTVIVFLTLATAFVAAPSFAQSSNDVIVGGKSIGQDPDANVRLQLRRDFGSEIDKLVGELYQTPADIVAELRATITEGAR